jgi:hypothetical protein
MTTGSPATNLPARHDPPGAVPWIAQRGATLAELLVVLFLLAVTVVVTSPYSLRWLNAEECRSAVYQTQMLLSLARVEAVSRNRPCRFEIDDQSRRVAVFDLNDPGNNADDIPLADIELPTRVAFSDPEGAAAITLAVLGGSRFGAVFEPDGVVSSGTGYIIIQGDEAWNRLSLYAAGGTRIERWTGAAWQAGS